jgi:uncharacterized alkaline shock family protein YloU
MELVTISTKDGNINISRITMETLIYIVLRNIKAIVGPRKTVFREITNKLIKGNQDQNENISQEIRIEISPSSVIVNLFLIINYGIRIPDLTWEIQAKVKEKLKECTGLEINKINVHIQGIQYPRKYRNNNQLVTQEVFVKIF